MEKKYCITESLKIEEQTIDDLFWFDVFFEIGGFFKIEAKDKNKARLIAEELLAKNTLTVEEILKTGISAEVTDVLREDSFFMCEKEAE